MQQHPLYLRHLAVLRLQDVVRKGDDGDDDAFSLAHHLVPSLRRHHWLHWWFRHLYRQDSHPLFEYELWAWGHRIQVARQNRQQEVRDFDRARVLGFGFGFDFVGFHHGFGFLRNPNFPGALFSWSQRVYSGLQR